MKSAMMNISGVGNVEPAEDPEFTAAVITVTGNSEVRPDIFKTVSSGGWIMYEMKQDQASLENIFRELTVGGANGTIQ